MTNSFASPSELQTALAQDGYLADEGLATALFVAMSLPQPLLLEGEAGVGKTQAAKSLAALLNTPLIRLQCYEGIDASESGAIALDDLLGAGDGVARSEAPREAAGRDAVHDAEVDHLGR